MAPNVMALQYYKRALKLAKSLFVDRKTLASSIEIVVVTCRNWAN